jgi:hypothetical protein
MTVSITFGLWLIPLIISIAIYAATWLLRTQSGGFVDFSPLANLVKLGVATILVIIVWLLYALAT